MAISGIGGMSSADMVAFLALQSSDDDKKMHDAQRHADEDVQHSEEEKEISSMQDQAIDSLVTGISSAVVEAGSAVGGAMTLNSKPTTDIASKALETERTAISTSFKAADTAVKGVGDAMGQFAAKDAAEHRILADREKSDADDCKSASSQARQSADQAIDAARAIRTAEDQVHLDASRRV